ncbi:hypothetical protein pipiens_017250 [Culex pipiens pipiens]|uniref:Transmembrane protein n=1 Tax=Culex pipiens pipiens TaxID=38569 RepID=A0ABD1CHF4_CULPP
MNKQIIHLGKICIRQTNSMFKTTIAIYRTSQLVPMFLRILIVQAISIITMNKTINRMSLLVQTLLRNLNTMLQANFQILMVVVTGFFIRNFLDVTVNHSE